MTYKKQSNAGFWVIAILAVIMGASVLGFWANADAECDGVLVRNVWNLPECVVEK